jgi:hypothetical protein
MALKTKYAKINIRICYNYAHSHYRVHFCQLWFITSDPIKDSVVPEVMFKNRKLELEPSNIWITVHIIRVYEIYISFTYILRSQNIHCEYVFAVACGSSLLAVGVMQVTSLTATQLSPRTSLVPQRQL